MRRTTAAALVLAATLVAAAPAGAKGIAAASVCGANGCHPVDRAAVRAGIDAYAPARAPRRAEPFFTLRMEARVSSGRVVEVFSLDWLPRAGLTRPSGEGTWNRPPPVMDRALRRAAAGLRAYPGTELGPIDGPTARVVEAFAPARDDDGGGGPGNIAIAIGAIAAILVALATLAQRRRRERPPATLAPTTR
jgi:hypothetical protein